MKIKSFRQCLKNANAVIGTLFLISVIRKVLFDFSSIQNQFVSIADTTNVPIALILVLGMILIFWLGFTLILGTIYYVFLRIRGFFLRNKEYIE